MPPIRYLALCIPLILTPRARAQVNIDVAGGLAARWSDAGSISRTHIPGIAGELGLSRGHGSGTRLRLDLGGALYPGQTVAIPECVPGAQCRTMRSLSHAAHATVGLDRPLGGGVSMRGVAGAGVYWTAASGADAGDGKRSAVAPGVNAGLSFGSGRVRFEGRGHLPISDLAEVQAMATVLMRVALASNR